MAPGRLAKAAGAEPHGQIRDEKGPIKTCLGSEYFWNLLEMSKKCTLLWREAYLEMKISKI